MLWKSQKVVNNNDNYIAGIARNRRTIWDHPNYSITKIGQNTEKSPGDLKGLIVIQIPVKYHQLTLVWILTRNNNNNNNNNDNNNNNNNT